MGRLRFERGRRCRVSAASRPATGPHGSGAGGSGSGSSRGAAWETLESRQLMCSTLFGGLHQDLSAASVATQSLSVAAAAPGGVSIAAETTPAGLPILHSLPGAPTAVYLDFDGYNANTPYDTDGSPNTFGTAE